MARRFVAAGVRLAVVTGMSGIPGRMAIRPAPTGCNVGCIHW